MKRITRRRFLGSLALGAVTLPLGACSPRTAKRPVSGPRRPNVLFIFHDQLRADACGPYGGRIVATPNLDRLAAEGVTFTNAVATCPLCAPYRAMMMTGRFPTHSGTVVNGVQVNPRLRGLGHTFRNAGYATGFIGKWHLAPGRTRYYPPEVAQAGPGADHRAIWERVGREHPNAEFVPPGPERLGFDYWMAYNFHQDFNRPWFYGDTPEKIHLDGFETDVETDLAIAFMTRNGDGPDPFLLVVAPHPPHPPLLPANSPPGYLKRIPEELPWSPNVPELHPHRQDPRAARCYHAMIRNADDNIGRLLAFLEESGLAENTIVVFTSDHGEMLGSHNMSGKCRPYAEAVNLPLLIRWPGRIPAGIIRETIYSPVEHLPTLCGLTGVMPPPGVDGLDLGAAVLGGDDIERPGVLMANYSSNFSRFETGTLQPEWRAVRTRRYTYIRWLRDGVEELYDNPGDPYQMINLAGQASDPEILSRLRLLLADLLATAHDEFLPGTAYADWYDHRRHLVHTALGPV
ncbi:MAG: sulfatase [bacterium]